MTGIRAIAAGIALLLGAGIWFQHALRSQWKAGYQAGEMTLRIQYQQQFERHRAKAEALRAASERRSLELEHDGETLRKKLSDLAQAVAKDSNSTSSCFSPDVMRALSKTGVVDRSEPRRSPRAH